MRGDVSYEVWRRPKGERTPYEFVRAFSPKHWQFARKLARRLREKFDVLIREITVTAEEVLPAKQT